ncbi:MAG: CsbD family protein [Coleofasciculaceae cyanobacterium SM2_1_6]|nr:CsbD family protein [Coleofasciculaceae cyanobacterium SM2_1_6]
MEDRIKATAKNIEGKVQNAVGDLIGDPRDQAEDKAKQAKASYVAKDIKDQVKKTLD